MKRGKRRPGVGDDAERRLHDAGDLGRIDVDADEIEVGVDAPAHLRLVQPGANRQHDIGFAPQLVGILSDLLAPSFANESLRIAMLCATLLGIPSAFFFLRASLTYREDVAAAAIRDGLLPGGH